MNMPESRAIIKGISKINPKLSININWGKRINAEIKTSIIINGVKINSYLSNFSLKVAIVLQSRYYLI